MSGQGFLPFPEWLLGHPQLAWGARVTLALLYQHERSKREQWPSVSTICAEMKEPRRNISRWLEALLDEGLVTSKRVGKEVVYAPSICAKNGARRDLSPEPEHAPKMAHESVAGHEPKMAHVANIHRTEVAHVTPEHTPKLSYINDGTYAKNGACSENDASYRARAPAAAPASDLRRDIRREENENARAHAGAQARDPESVPESVPKTRGALIAGYQRRYEKATGQAWLSAPKVGANLDVVAAWCDTEPDPLDAVERVLDGVFADEWMAAKRWPWGPIANDPAKFAGNGATTAAVATRKQISARLTKCLDELEAARKVKNYARVRELEDERDAIAAESQSQKQAYPVSSGDSRSAGENRSGQSGARIIGGLFGPSRQRG